MAKKFVNGEWIEYGQEVTLTGSIVPLAEITTDTTVTAGSSLSLLPITKSGNYKSLRSSGYMVNADSKLQIRTSNYTSNNGSITRSNILDFSTGQFKQGNVDIYSDHWDIDIYNANTVDQAVRRLTVIGVK